MFQPQGGSLAIMHQHQPAYHFNNKMFSHLATLINFTHQTPSSECIKQIKQLQEEFHSSSYSKYDHLMLTAIRNLAVQTHDDNKTTQNHNILALSLKAFLNVFSQSKSRILNIDNISSNYQQIQFMVCDQKRAYSLKQEIQRLKDKDKQSKNNKKNISKSIKTMNKSNNINNNNQQQCYKAYVIYGKAISVQRQKKSTSPIIETEGQVDNPTSLVLKGVTNEEMAARQQTISNLQYCMSLMYEQQKLVYSKCEPHQLEDLLLTHWLNDTDLLPIIVANQVYKYFVPIDSAILLIIPQSLIEPSKQQPPLIFKNTLLHIYINHMKLLISKCMSKQTLFKNSTFRGIYFVEEGEVQTKSGRIVARGWVINGKCKSITHVWKFHKVITFFKYILHNQNIWKQFLNDIKLNNQHPLKIADILNIDDTLYEQIMGRQSANFKPGPNNQRGKRIKFPSISGRLNKSFDLNKLTEIEKMKHFDQKIQLLHQVKQEVLKKKIDYGAKRLGIGKEAQSMIQMEQKEMNKRVHILSQKMNLPQRPLKTDASKSLFLPPGESSANILITGIVQKLKSIHDAASNRNSLQQSPRQENKKRIMQINKSRSKILGVRRYQQMARYDKNHLYKGRNFYN